MDTGHCCHTAYLLLLKVLRCALRIAWLIVDSGKSQQASAHLFLLASRHLWFKRQTLQLLFRGWRLIRNCFLTPCARRSYLQKCLIWTHLFRFICTSGQSLLKELLDTAGNCQVWGVPTLKGTADALSSGNWPFWCFTSTGTASILP